MTISSTKSRWEYTGDSTTKIFSYSNKIFAAAELEVYSDNVLQTLTTDYTVSGVGLTDGGSVSYVTAPANDVDIVIIRIVADTQATDYPVGGSLPSGTIEDDFDRRTIVSQQKQEKLDRAILTPAGEFQIDMTLPTVANRLSKAFQFDSAGAPVVVSPTDASGTNVTATGSVTLRSLAERFADTYNVLDYGAKGDGTTDDLAEFQAVVNSLPDVVGPHLIVIPAGSYEGALAGLTLGNRTITWLHLGDVSYVTSAPPGSRFNDNFDVDGRAWLVGGWGAAIDDTAAIVARPTFDVRRNTNHTAGGGAGVVRTALNVTHNVLTVLDNFENALTVVLEDRVIQTSSNSFAGAQIEVRRLLAAIASNAALFGQNIVVKDQTAAASVASGGALVGLEINIVATGLDDGNKRILLDLIPKILNDSGTAGFEAGLRIKPSTTGGTATIAKGILLEPGGGAITRGIDIEAASEAIFISGGPTNAVIEARVTNQATLRLGSTRDTIGDIVAALQLSGDDAGGNKTTYGEIRGVITDPTDTSEDGRMDILIPIAGTLTTVFRMNAAVAADPVLMRVQSTLKAVTQGADDSGDAGFAVLQVPN